MVVRTNDGDADSDAGAKKKRPATKEQCSANQRNSMHSKGPTSRAGKDKSKYNSVTHACTAKTLRILPGEDPGALERRHREWADRLRPDDPVEAFFVGGAVASTWLLERTRRAIDAKLTTRVRKAAAEYDAALAAEVNRLVPRLPEDPAEVVRQLRRSSFGCRWLLGQWGLLGEHLKGHASLEPGMSVRGLLLLGRRPADFFTDPGVIRWNVAQMAAHWDAHEAATVTQMAALVGFPRPEGMADDEYERRMARSFLTRPELEEGRATLRAIVGGAMEELGALAGRLEADEADERALAVDEALGDASAEGARLSRYATSHHRAVRDDLKQFLGLADRRKREDETSGAEEPAPAASARGGMPNECAWWPVGPGFVSSDPAAAEEEAALQNEPNFPEVVEETAAHGGNTDAGPSGGEAGADPERGPIVPEGFEPVSDQLIPQSPTEVEATVPTEVGGTDPERVGATVPTEGAVVVPTFAVPSAASEAAPEATEAALQNEPNLPEVVAEAMACGEKPAIAGGTVSFLIPCG